MVTFAGKTPVKVALPGLLAVIQMLEVTGPCDFFFVKSHTGKKKHKKGCNAEEDSILVCGMVS